MGKKCLPGVICIENMTLFLLFVIAVILIYIFYNTTGQKSTIVVLGNDLGKSRENNTDHDPMSILRRAEQTKAIAKSES